MFSSDALQLVASTESYIPFKPASPYHADASDTLAIASKKDREHAIIITCIICIIAITISITCIISIIIAIIIVLTVITIMAQVYC